MTGNLEATNWSSGLMEGEVSILGISKRRCLRCFNEFPGVFGSFKFCDRFSKPKNTRDITNKVPCADNMGPVRALEDWVVWLCSGWSTHRTIEGADLTCNLNLTLHTMVRPLGYASMRPCLSTVVRHCSLDVTWWKFRDAHKHRKNWKNSDLSTHIPSQLNMPQPRWGVCEYSHNEYHEDYHFNHCVSPNDLKHPWPNHLNLYLKLGTLQLLRWPSDSPARLEEFGAVWHEDTWTLQLISLQFICCDLFKWSNILMTCFIHRMTHTAIS